MQKKSRKTKSSIRKIEILDILYPYLENHKAIFGEKEYVFTSKFKKPFYSSVKTSMFY